MWLMPKLFTIKMVYALRHLFYICVSLVSIDRFLFVNQEKSFWKTSHDFVEKRKKVASQNARWFGSVRMPVIFSVDMKNHIDLLAFFRIRKTPYSEFRQASI